MPDAPIDDVQIINEAYQDQLKKLFGVLYDSIAVQGLDAKVAAQKFAAQVVQLQAVKQAASDALPKSASFAPMAKIKKSAAKRTRP
ncbi:hypothetical protein [Dyella sp. Tek66A03]|uniref:hypothetical protein n=1 Tax=Dyella sp. Tek66A03 TaxID=3458298 RepID=UPI00403E3DCB